MRRPARTTERRPLLIFTILSALILTLFAADTVRRLLAPPPMPPEMKCVIEHNCWFGDYSPVAPLRAPRMSDIRPLDANGEPIRPDQKRGLKNR